MSWEELLQASLASDVPQGGIDLRFRHDEREGSIEGLGFSRRVEDPSRLVEYI